MKRTSLLHASRKHASKTLLLIAFLTTVITTSLVAQTKIGDNPGTPRDASAMLEVSSSAAPFRGFLMPRITTAQRGAITLPAKGLMIFNTTSNQVEVNTGTPAAPVWASPAPPLAWSLTGNAGTNQATQFLGTTDLQALIFRTNNLERMRISNNGFLGIGAAPPSEKLHVDGGSAMVTNDAATTNPAFLAVAENSNGGTMDDITIRTYGTAASAGFEQYTARGTAAAPQPVVNGQNMGNLTFYGYTSAGIQGARSFITSLYAGNGTNNRTSMLIGTSDVERIRITDAGFVGIGTTAPAQTVDVAGTARISASAGTATAVVGRNAAGDISNLALGAGLSITGGTLNTTAASGWSLTGNAGTNPATNFIGTTDAQPLVLRSNNTEQMRILANGNVGIGTATANSSLSFSSTLAPKITLYDGGSTTDHYGLGVSASSLNYHVGGASAAHRFFAGGKNGDGTELMRIQGNGFVGIGTAAPVYHFHMLSDGGGIGVADDIGISSFGAATSPGLEINSARGTAAAPSNLTGPGTLGRIAWNGYANNSPDGALVAINAFYTGDGTTSTTRMSFVTSGIERFFISDAGAVGIGTATPTATLSVNGDANNITGVWGVFSDDRIKTVDENFIDGLSTVMKIRPVKFHYNADAPFKADEAQVGIVAQEMEAIAPYMISKVKAGAYNDLRKYNAQALPYMLVNAVQELKQELDAVKAENEKLKAGLSNLSTIKGTTDEATIAELLARIKKLEGTLGVAGK